MAKQSNIPGRNHIHVPVNYGHATFYSEEENFIPSKETINAINKMADIAYKIAYVESAEFNPEKFIGQKIVFELGNEIKYWNESGYKYGINPEIIYSIKSYVDGNVNPMIILVSIDELKSFIFVHKKDIAKYLDIDIINQ